MQFLNRPYFFGHMIVNPRDRVVPRLTPSGSLEIDLLTLSIIGATGAEMAAVYDAINTAISNAKARAALASEPIAEAVE